MNQLINQLNIKNKKNNIIDIIILLIEKQEYIS